MALPSLPRKEPRTVSVTVRLSGTRAAQLKELARGHNMSQADVIEYLIEDEWKVSVKKKVVVELWKRDARYANEEKNK